MQIVYKQPEELIPYDKNSRVHSDYQINQIKKSILHFGFINPVLINGNNIVAGHGRTRAAKELGLTEIPAIDVSNLSEEQLRAYVIADNKIAQNAEWDKELLMMELDALKELDFDVSILGFDLSEIEIKNIDYSVLDNEDEIEEKLDSLERETRRAIEIVFEEQDYQEAYELFKFWKQQGAYLGQMVMQYLKDEKNKL